MSIVIDLLKSLLGDLFPNPKVWIKEAAEDIIQENMPLLKKAILTAALILLAVVWMCVGGSLMFVEIARLLDEEGALRLTARLIIYGTLFFVPLIFCLWKLRDQRLMDRTERKRNEKQQATLKVQQPATQAPALPGPLAGMGSNGSKRAGPHASLESVFADILWSLFDEWNQKRRRENYAKEQAAAASPPKHESTPA